MTHDQNWKAVREEFYAEADKQTLDTLPAFLKALSEREHDYNTICFAVSAAAVAAAKALNRSPAGGITGFQGGAVMWEFMERWNGVKPPARLIQYENALYPQYADKFAATLSKDTFDWLKEEAQKHLTSDEKFMHEEVRAHMQSIVDGKPPFGMRVTE